MSAKRRIDPNYKHAYNVPKDRREQLKDAIELAEKAIQVDGITVSLHDWVNGVHVYSCKWCALREEAGLERRV